MTGAELGAALSEAAGHAIAYRRFSDALLDSNPFLARLAALVDEGRLAGRADLAALRAAFPGLATFREWLEGPGKALLDVALTASSKGVALR